MTRKVVLEATVVRFKWQNPHAFIEADANVSGQTERWAIEMTSPNNLTQSRRKRTSLKPADRVKIHVHPPAQRRRGGAYAGVVFADGSRFAKSLIA